MSSFLITLLTIDLGNRDFVRKMFVFDSEFR